MVSGRYLDPSSTSVFQNTEYLYFAREKVSSITASCRCRGWNATLVQIKNKAVQLHIEENMPISKTYCSQPNKYRSFYYIGLYLLRGEWTWPDNTTLGSFRKWNVRSRLDNDLECNEPNGYKTTCFDPSEAEYFQNSTQIFACNGPNLGNWYDKPDSSRWFYICERPKTNTNEILGKSAL